MSRRARLNSQLICLALVVGGLIGELSCSSSSSVDGNGGVSGARGGVGGGSPGGSTSSAGTTEGGASSHAGGVTTAGAENANAGAGGVASFCQPPTVDEPFSKSLAGTWDFTPGGGQAGKIQVPGGGWVKQGFSATSGTYSTQITVPDSGAPQTTLIEFGAVNFQATLAIDDTAVGTNTTSFTPSVFDVTKFVKPGKQQNLTLLVKGHNDPALVANGKDLVPVAAPWSDDVAQGIFRSATLRVLPSVYISDTFVRTSVADDSFSYDVTVTNTGSSDQQVSLASALSSWNCSAFAYPAIPSAMITVPAASSKVASIGPIKWGLGPTSYWWPNVPYQAGYQAQLHDLKVDMSANGVAIHSAVVRFGFRDITQQRADATHVYYYLNGVHVRFHGDNLQGADYDSIDNGGKGDAYDTLPGFMPPSPQNAGWPGAITNYQKLNYNFIRVHQELASPYMLDTADELGMMLMGETAIRGSNQNEDFVIGHDNMVNHAKAMVLRDRNHPSIVRWSQSNEPNFEKTDSSQFEQDLYQAMNGLDGTRPISVDEFGGPNFYGITAPNFSSFGHYLNGVGAYSDQVASSPDHPFGQGELIWDHDNTAQGLCWFGTSVMAMRAQDASDMRPYALLSGWSSIIPGVQRASMTLEQKTPPLFGEDNLADPWSNPIIMRIQRANSPVLVADADYWNITKLSNADGDWPADVPELIQGSSVTRTLLIFNDTFSGTKVDISWEVHSDTPTGTLGSNGKQSVDVPLGGMATQQINITVPSAGSKFYLLLEAQKDGSPLFNEDGAYFNILPPNPLPAGTLTLVSRNSSKCLDVTGNASADGTNIEQLACSGGPSQGFHFESLGGTSYRIHHVSSGKCVAVAGGGFADNTNVQLAACDTSSAQTFDAFPTSSGYFAFRRLNTSSNNYSCLDVYGESTSDGGNVDEWDCSYHPNQEWLPK